MTIRIFLITIFISNCLLVQGQSVDARVKSIKSEFGSYPEQIEAFLLLRDELIKKNFSDSLGLVNYSIGNRKFLTGKYKEALPYLFEAIEGFDIVNYSGYRYLACYYYILQCYSSTFQYKEGVKLSSKIQALPRSTNQHISTYVSCIVELAKIYSSLGDVDASITELRAVYTDHIFDSLPIFYKKFVLIEFSKSLYIKGDESSLIESKSILNQLEDLYYKDTQSSLSIIDSSYINLSRAQIALRERDTALAVDFTIDMIQKISKHELSGSLTLELINNSRTMSVALAGLGRYEEGFERLQSVESLLSLDTTLTNLQRALFTQNLAMAALRTNRIKESKAYFDSVFEFLDFNPTLDPAYKCRDQGNKSVIADVIFDYLSFIKRRDEKSGKDYASESLVYMNKMDTILTFAIEDVLFDQSKISLKDKFYKYYLKAIDLTAKFGKASEFLKFAEKSQGLLILDAQARNGHAPFQEHSTLDSLEYEEVKILYDLQKSETDNLYEQLIANRKNQLDVKSELREIMGHNTSVNSLIFADYKNLDDDLLYYQFGVDSLYGLHLAGNASTLKPLCKKEDIAREVEELFNALKVGQSVDSLSSLIYRRLIGPFNIKDESLQIIPTDFLNLLPFEVLIDEEGKELVERQNISYTISLTLNQLWSQLEVQRISDFQVVSPSYNIDAFSGYLQSITKSRSGTTFPYLKYSKEEADFLSTEFEIEKLNTNVDKPSFFNILKAANVFHFTGHSVLDKNVNELSFLALGNANTSIDSIVTFAEISGSRTSAELVFLNSCNTGTGKILKGEGVYNLSRAFFNAGAKAVVNSLWEIDDESSKDITIAFYSHLKQGVSKSEALRQAKLDYLNSDIPEFKKHPYYWAGLVLVGNDAPLEFSSWLDIYGNTLLLLGLPLICGLVYVLKRQNFL